MTLCATGVVPSTLSREHDENDKDEQQETPEAPEKPVVRSSRGATLNCGVIWVFFLIFLCGLETVFYLVFQVWNTAVAKDPEGSRFRGVANEAVASLQLTCFIADFHIITRFWPTLFGLIGLGYACYLSVRLAKKGVNNFISGSAKAKNKGGKSSVIFKVRSKRHEDHEDEHQSTSSSAGDITPKKSSTKNTTQMDKTSEEKSGTPTTAGSGGSGIYFTKSPINTSPGIVELESPTTSTITTSGEGEQSYILVEKIREVAQQTLRRRRQGEEASSTSMVEGEGEGDHDEDREGEGDHDEDNKLDAVCRVEGQRQMWYLVLCMAFLLYLLLLVLLNYRTHVLCRQLTKNEDKYDRAAPITEYEIGGPPDYGKPAVMDPLGESASSGEYPLDVEPDAVYVDLKMYRLSNDMVAKIISRSPKEASALVKAGKKMRCAQLVFLGMSLVLSLATVFF
ncbi:unnamed protein product [Amoebophrya sp. A25]|nr:unnamed protein product [Amoebophrya sp. A25]|eukprot:GSA25T00001613001.1